MKLKDLEIGTQLRIGLGVILAIVICLGALAWVQMDLLWQETKGLYDHPLVVRRAIGEITADSLTMQRGTIHLCLAEDGQERQTILQGMDVAEADAHRQFDVLYNSYLGPRSDIDEAFQAFVQWKAIRAETIRLLQEGKIAEATRRTKPSGVDGDQAERVLSHIQDISKFASDRGDRFYLAATQLNDSLKLQLGIVVGVILFLCLGLSYILLKAINDPLRELTAVTDRYRQGKLDARIQYVSANEFGTLAAAFNQMAETVQTAMVVNANAAALAGAMLREEELHAFCRELLQALIEHTRSQVGAVYLLNEQKTDYEHLESIGLGFSGRASFSATGREGEFGAALATQQIQRITDIPADSRFTFAAVSGEFTPREIITIPVLAGHEVAAVISLASIRSYPDPAVRLVSAVWSLLTARLNGVLLFRQLRASFDKLERQNRQLQAQQEELRIANEELEEQTRQLQQTEKELKAQQEELQVSNEELEEKNDLLERQKMEIERGRKEIEQKAEAIALASRYKSEFLANMSHELRTPLNSLLLLAQGLARNKDGNLTGEQVEAARIIHGSGSDLLTLINEILDLSKIEAGRMDLQVGTVRVSDLVEGVRDSFMHLANEKGIGLELVVTEDAPSEISSDGKRVEQVIRNLVSNALKFTEAGSVTVTFSRPAPGTGFSESGLAMAVRDTGIGIPPELHKVIFEAFQQADGGTSRKFGGTGLGLSISRELASLLGGEIRLESEPRKGSTFTLYLPRETGRPAPVRHDAAALPKQLSAAENRPASIPAPDDRDTLAPSDRVMLVIEDDPNFARVLYGKCREKGFKCLAATTGETGLELATKYLPGAVILDLRLPGMDGWDVLSALKENIRTRHIPVHIISAEEASTRSLRKGAVGHLAKPVNPEALEEAFRRLEQVSTVKPKCLLVVDDDAAIRRETVNLVGNGDVTVDEAESGEQALEALRSRPYDCVVLDLGLPDMDGGELLARLEREGVALPPVVVYTARDLTLDEEAAIRERAESIVIKDVRSQERLLDEVSLFLHRVVSRMSEKKQKVIQDLHYTDALLRDKKVLVVDDDMRTTFAIAHLLAEGGMKPLKAASGQRALRLLEEQPDVDLVLMDIMMPVMDGYETMRRIRAQDRFRTLPIIALTAKALPEDRAKCLATGANDYLPKPLDPGRLFSMIRVWLCR